MKHAFASVAVLCLVLPCAALAQEHWTEGPVWQVSYYRTDQGKFDQYLEWLRAHYLVTSAQAKARGLILDTKVYVKDLESPDDLNVAIATLFPSYAAALDYSADDEAKNDAIQAAHWGTMDEDAQAEMAAQRFALRAFVGSDMAREVTLRPME